MTVDCTGSGSEDLAEVAAAIDRLIDDGMRDLAATRERSGRIQRDIEALETRLDDLRRARALVVGGDAGTQEPPSRPERDSTEATTKHRNGSLSALIRDCAADALKRAGRPMNRVELLEVVRAGGLKVEGKDPAKRVGRIMWGSKQFQHVGEGYWFAGEPVPRTPGAAET